MIENACLALVFTSQKLQHYFLTHAMHLLVHYNLVHYLLQQPALSGRVGTMALKLIKFDIKCITQKVVQGQAIVELLASYSVPPSKKERRNAFQHGRRTIEVDFIL